MFQASLASHASAEDREISPERTEPDALLDITLLRSEFAKDIGRYGYPDQDQDPYPTFQDVVVVNEPVPRMFHDVMPEQKFKGHCQGQPDEPYCNGLAWRGDIPRKPEQPQVQTRENDQGEC